MARDWIGTQVANKAYWQIDDETALGATEKAGYTSIKFAMSTIRARQLSPDMVRQRGLKSRLYLRHPITRFASAWAYFAPNDNYPVQPSRPQSILAVHPTIEQFTDAVLTGEIENEHWSPQLAQHMPIDEVLRFECIYDTFPCKLDHHNRGRIAKPEITYRLDALQNYYREDLEAWLAAPSPHH